jgi:histidinol phosphatase-like PHP family hydrolase
VSRRKGMKIDLHVHAKERSACAPEDEETIIRAAMGHGLDGLAFTDHNKYIGAERLAELNERYAPFRVFRGIEVTTVEQEDIVVLGVFEPELEQAGWKYPDLHALVRRQGGFLVLAHPYRYRKEVRADVAACPPDAIEISFSASNQAEIEELIALSGARPISNSDGHRSLHVGMYYTYLHRTPADDAELVAILKAGDYDCCGMPGRLEAVNRELSAMEAVIRQMIAEGRDRDYYRQTTGNSVTLFDRVQRGDSFVKRILPEARPGPRRKGRRGSRTRSASGGADA